MLRQEHQIMHDRSQDPSSFPLAPTFAIHIDTEALSVIFSAANRTERIASIYTTSRNPSDPLLLE
jgi:hypothetical protein